MKQIVSNYSYSPATNVVTLTGVNIDADQLLLIVAPQVGRTLYNFASVTGVVSAGADTRVTLNASTSGLTTTSPLVIFYDDQASTQTVAGTVTASLADQLYDSGTPVFVAAYVNSPGGSVIPVSQDANSGMPISGTISGTVTVGNSVTIGSLPAISGTVTVGAIGGSVTIPVRLFAEAEGGPSSGQDTLVLCDSGGQLLVNAKSGGASVLGYDGNAFVQVKQVSGSSVTIGSLPAISGTVTANASNGSLTTRFGTPTTANTAFATSAVTNANRKYLLIQNVTTGSNVITVGIGFTPTTTQGIQLTAGAGITFESSYIPTGAIYILSSVTASNFTILEA